jgi:outer membrane protein assembly factor BamB
LSLANTVPNWLAIWTAGSVLGVRLAANRRSLAANRWSRPSGRHHDDPMSTPRSVPILILCLLLAGCTDADQAAPTTSTAPSPSPSQGVRIQAVIDLKGGEAYGLAIAPTAVWAVAYQASTLSRVDPTTNAVTSSVQLPRAASVLATADAIWVVGYGGPAEGALYRVDPATGRAVATITGAELCCDLSAGDGALWAVDPRGAVLRVDPVTNKLAQRFDVAMDRNAHINAVYAGGSIWVSSDTTPLTRIDPRTNARTTVNTGGGVPFFARDGKLWGAAPDRLWVVDQRTGQIDRQVPLADSIEVISLELGFDAIWVGIRRPDRIGAVVKLDASTGQVLGELRDITIPARIAIGFGSVWVTDSGSASLYRLAPGP